MARLRLPHRAAGALLIVLGALLAGCLEVAPRPAPSAAADAEAAWHQGDFDRAAQAFLELADAHPRERAHYRLRAAEAWRENGDLDAAAEALAGIKPQRLDAEEAVRYALIEAEVALARGAPAPALETLGRLDLAALPPPLKLRALELRARAEAASGHAIASARTRVELDRGLAGADRAQNEGQIRATLQALGADALKREAAALAPGDPLLPWLDQALRAGGQALPLVVLRPNQPVGTFVPGPGGTQREGYRAVRKVGLLLPGEGPLGAVAQPVRDGVFAARFADSNPQRPDIAVYDAGGTAQGALAAYRQAVSDGADHVVGPLTREAVSALFAQGALPVPVLALNQPERGETPPPGSAAFGLTPDAEGAQAAEHLLERGIRQAVVITATEDWAERAALAFRAQFESRNGRILNEARLRDNEVNYAAAIRQALSGVAAGKAAPALPGAVAPSEAAPPPDTAIFISMRPQQARLLLPQLKLAGYAGVPVFATSHIYAGDYDPGLDRDLDGVEFCDAPWLFDLTPGLPARSAIARTLDSARGAGARLFALGLDAYALLPYLEWLGQHHDSYLPGATGQLAEDDAGRIQRLLVWAQFDNGAARPVNGGLHVGAAPPAQP
jgi:outer membrane PBP1 activator LpoA protein